jgi:hypothetical protein
MHIYISVYQVGLGWAVPGLERYDDPRVLYPEGTMRKVFHRGPKNPKINQLSAHVLYTPGLTPASTGAGPVARLLCSFLVTGSGPFNRWMKQTICNFELWSSVGDSNPFQLPCQLHAKFTQSLQSLVSSRTRIEAASRLSKALQQYHLQHFGLMPPTK